MRRQIIVATIAGAVLGSSTLAIAQQSPGTPKKLSIRPQGFNVVLVLADLEAGPATSDNVPVAARKALADMKDFLPYKGYRLLDTAWILSGSDSTNTTTRLHGLDERTYELTLTADPETSPAVSNRALRVSFQLRDSVAREAVAVPSASATPTLDYLKSQMAADAERRGRPGSEPAPARTQAAEMEKQAAALDVELRTLRERLGEANPQVLGKKADLDRIMSSMRALRAETEARRQALHDNQTIEFKTAEGVMRFRVAQAPPTQRIIETGFTMDVGETVVVGTSRVRGDKAIIALLTAVPRNGQK